MPIRGTGSHVAHASNGSVGAAFGLDRTAFLAPAIAVAADGSDLAVAQQPVEIDVKTSSVHQARPRTSLSPRSAGGRAFALICKMFTVRI